MVQLADPDWTAEALYRASILARKNGSPVVGVKMLPVQHPSWLGTAYGNLALSAQNRAQMENAALTAEDYGVCYATTVFQYFSLVGGLLEVADVVNAGVVFAALPNCAIPGWTRWQMSRLRSGLLRQGRVLIGRTHAGLVPATG
jgi:hypothetical protein